jgi:hypothetical protein
MAGFICSGMSSVSSLKYVVICFGVLGSLVNAFIASATPLQSLAALIAAVTLSTEALSAFSAATKRAGNTTDAGVVALADGVGAVVVAALVVAEGALVVTALGVESVGAAVGIDDVVVDADVAGVADAGAV